MFVKCRMYHKIRLTPTPEEIRYKKGTVIGRPYKLFVYAWTQNR